MHKMLVYGTVILTGSAAGLAEARRDLRQDFHCYHYRDNAMLVQDVHSHELHDFQHMANAYGLEIEDIRDEYEYEEPTVQVERKAKITLDVLAGHWYKVNQDAFPLIHVTRARHETNGEELVWLFDVELVDSRRMPMPTTMTAEQLKECDPKPASLKDFEELDITPPAEFVPAPHVIPDAKPEKKEAAVVKGTKLDQALLAQQLLLLHHGTRVSDVRLAKVDLGYGVEARAQDGLFGLPTGINGTPITYR